VGFRAVETVGLLAEDVIERELVGHAGKRRLDHRCGISDPPIRPVDLGTVIGQQAQCVLIVDLDSDLGEHDLCLGDDALGEVVVEQLKPRSHSGPRSWKLVRNAG